MEIEGFLSRLEDYGLDLKGVDNRFCGDLSLYIQCFSEFMTNNSFLLLDQMMTTKNYKDAFETSHAMKGIAGNLGLKYLYNSLSVLTESLWNRNLDNLEKEYKKVKEEFLQLEQLYKLELNGI